MNGSITLARIHAEQKAQAYYQLKEYPELQAEAIARHYVAHATVALQLLKILDLRRCPAAIPEQIDPIINHLVDQIKTNHAYSFGIELEWTEK